MSNTKYDKAVYRIAIGIFAVVGIGTGIFLLKPEETESREPIRDISLEMTSSCEEMQRDTSPLSYGDDVRLNLFLDEGESIRIGDNIITSRGSGRIALDGDETKAIVIAPDSQIPVRTESFVYHLENRTGFYDNTEVVIRRSCERS